MFSFEQVIKYNSSEIVPIERSSSRCLTATEVPAIHTVHNQIVTVHTSSGRAKPTRRAADMHELAQNEQLRQYLPNGISRLLIIVLREPGSRIILL